MDPIQLKENEAFKQINGYPNYYVSNDGRVYNKKTKRFIGADDDRGYIAVTLHNEEGQQIFKVHRLVMQVFGPPQPDDANEVDHINHDRKDNRIENLRWATRSENTKNKSANNGVEYEYFDEIPADNDDIIDVRDYGTHKFEDLYFADELFYFDTGVNYRRLHINYAKNGSAFVWAHNTGGKFVRIYYTKFKRLYGLE